MIPTLVFASVVLLSNTASSAPCAPQSSVHVVDAALGSGANFASIGAAVAAASEGDIVLIRSGDYPEFVVIDALGLTLQGDPSGGSAPVLGSIEVKNLGSAQHVAVRGLQFAALAALPGTPGSIIDVHDNRGEVWMEDIDMVLVPISVTSTASIVDSDSFVMSNFMLAGIMVGTTGTPTVRVTRSSAYLFDGTVRAPSCFFCSGSSTIAAGVECDMSVVGFYDCAVTGAFGTFDSLLGEDGGPGVRDLGGTEIYVQDSTIQGGPPASGQHGGTGVQGPAFELSTGTLHAIASLARTHTASSPVRDDESINITVQGVPGDLVWAYLAASPGAGLIRSTFDVPVLLGGPLARVAFGALPASGVANVTVPIGDLGPGVQGITIYVQALHLDMVNPRFVFSEPTAVTLLDAMF